MHTSLRCCAFVMWFLFLPADLSQADPCGMVPPVYTGEGAAIRRLGEQMTYVFYHNGVQSIIIRPGFSGSVEEFGMLIPFPSPPALRKVPDGIFESIATAIDPPEVIVDLTQPKPHALPRSGQGNGNANPNDMVRMIRRTPKPLTIKVLRQEAVGMYQVAVLKAGSAAALKRWMGDNGYRFPNGMENVCNEYIAERWCFVAVKTRVGQMSGASPRPGQREVGIKLAGSAYDGHVQGMGFRFRTDKLVVPMRLSAFNDGDLRNIIYLLTDSPQRPRCIPEEYVVRQVKGQRLHDNLIKPAPVRILGGNREDFRQAALMNQRVKLIFPGRRASWYRGKQAYALAEWYRPWTRARREAVLLFSYELHSARTKTLALPHDERQKALLRISERFGLRGKAIDELISRDAYISFKPPEFKQELTHLRSLTMTVIDGDFPREVLAGRNLTFADYRMSSRRNRRENYDSVARAAATIQEGDVVGPGELPELTRSLRSELLGGVFRSQSFIVLLATSFTFSMTLLAGLWLGRRWRSRTQGD